MLQERVLTLLQWGSERTGSFALQRKILHVNAAALLVLVALTGFGLAYLATGNPALLRSAFIQLPVMAIAALTPWANHRGWHGAARWALLLGTTAMVALGVRFGSGTFLDLHTVHIVLAMAAGLLFPLRQWPAVAVLAPLNVALYLHGKFIGVAPPDDLLLLSDGVLLGFRVGYVGITLVSILLIAWVSEQSAHRNEQVLEELSGVDALTGLANRRRVMQRLEEALATSRRIDQFVGVIFADLDNFKPLNDAHGHDAGDALLREVGQRIRSVVREMDLPGRLGGDEFVVVLSHLGSDREGAMGRMRRVSEAVRLRLSEPYRVELLAGRDGATTVVHLCTASIGVAIARGEESDPEALLQRADAAMYRAKAAGRNRVEVDRAG